MSYTRRRFSEELGLHQAALEEEPLTLQTLLPILRLQYDLEITGINFLGASLGALEGVYLSVIDADERKIGIDKFLLVNPPLDLSYAFAKVDEWDAFQNRFGRGRSQALVAKALGIVESFSKDNRNDPAVFDKLAKALSVFTTEELQFLIAEDLQAPPSRARLCHAEHSRPKRPEGA